MNTDQTHLQCLQKVFTCLDFFHILLCYGLNLKLIVDILVTGLNTITHYVKSPKLADIGLWSSGKVKGYEYFLKTLYITVDYDLPSIPSISFKKKRYLASSQRKTGEIHSVKTSVPDVF